MKRHQQSMSLEEDTNTSAHDVSSKKRAKPSEGNISSLSHANSIVHDSLTNATAYNIESVEILQDQILELQKRKAITDNQNVQLQMEFDDLKKKFRNLQHRKSSDSDSEAIQTLKTHNFELREFIKEKEVLNSEQQNLHEKLYQKWEIENSELASKLKNVEAEHQDIVKEKEEKTISLKTELEEMRQELIFQRNEAAQKSYETNWEIEKLEEELFEAKKEVKEKDEKVAQLQESRLIIVDEDDENDKNEKNEKNDKNDKIDITDKTDKNDITDKLAKTQVELVKAQNQCAIFETQLKTEKQNYLLKFNEIKSQYANFVAENVQLKNEKEKFQTENSNFQKIIQNLKIQLSQLHSNFATKESQLFRSETDLEEAKKECKNIQQNFLDEKLKSQKLEKELSKFQKVVKEKEKQIFEQYQKLQNAQKKCQNECILKAKILADHLLAAEKQVHHWKTKFCNAQGQNKNLEATLAQEKLDYKKVIEKIKAEKEKIQKEFADFQLSTNAQTLHLRKINDENHRKLDEALRHKNDAIITNMKGPKWIVSKEICQAVFASNPKLIDFLKHYTALLFSQTEILLSEATLNGRKWKEAKTVIFHFFKPDGQKSIYVNLLQKEMQTKRRLARADAYKQCHQNRAIGFGDNGKKYFFQLQSNNSNEWKPFADKEFQQPLTFKAFQNSCIFCYPIDLPAPEYIVIVSLQMGGHGIYKVTAAGYIQIIFSKAINGSEKKATNI